MNLTVLKKYFKARPLVYTVAFSALIHLLALGFFSTWDSSSNPDWKKVIKVKYLLEKKVIHKKRIPSESKNKIERKIAPREKAPEIIRPSLRPKPAIIKNVEAVSIPPFAKRNPVPIRNLENLFKPVSAVLKHASMHRPVSEYTKKTPLNIHQAMHPSPRIIRETRKQRDTLVPLTQLAMRSPDAMGSLNKIMPNKPFRPVPQITKSSASVKTVPLNSPVAFSSPLPFALAGMPSASQPVARVNSLSIIGTSSPSTTLREMKPQTFNQPTSVARAGKKVFNPLSKSRFAQATQARAFQRLDVESVAHYQPTTPTIATHFSSPLRGASLLKAASIPPGFYEENSKHEKKVTSRAFEKVARLSDGVSELPAELLSQIRDGFSAKIWSRISQVKYYPRIARKRGFEGQPVVAFTLGTGGELLDLSLETPSPFRLLNEAALDAVKSASPYPPLPELLKINSMKFNLPISFILEEQ